MSVCRLCKKWFGTTFCKLERMVTTVWCFVLSELWTIVHCYLFSYLLMLCKSQWDTRPINIAWFQPITQWKIRKPFSNGEDIMIIRIPGQVWHWVLTSPLVKPARRGDGGEWIPRWNLIFVNEVNLVEISFSRPLNADDTNKNLRDGENEVETWKQDISWYIN